MLLTILLATFVSSFVSLLGAFLLAKKGQWSQPFALHLTALSSGVLLTTALLHLAPEALQELNSQQVFTAIFAGIVAFFLLERLVFWYHHHHESHGPKPSAWLIMIGDSLHNFIDGATIATTIIINPTLGLLTTLAIGAHEIPQEIADFATMVNSGVSKKKALLFNGASALAAFAGALVMFIFRTALEPYLPYVVAFSAGMFLYIALSDLIPELHRHTVKQKEKWIQLIWFFAGVGLLLATTTAIGDSHLDEHNDNPREYNQLTTMQNILLPNLETPSQTWIMYENLTINDTDRTGNWRFVIKDDGCFYHARNTQFFVNADEGHTSDPAFHWNTQFPEKPVRCFTEEQFNQLKTAVENLHLDELDTFYPAESAQQSSHPIAERWTVITAGEAQTIVVEDGAVPTPLVELRQRIDELVAQAPRVE
jgi:zinc and cadmium transporter